MGTRGPAKGEGGRPRKKGGSRLTKGKNAGYVKVTVGPKSKGTQKYEHRVKMGLGKGSKTGGKVVHHKNGKGDNSSLEITTRREHPKKKEH
jgi:hypothetical protein